MSAAPAGAQDIAINASGVGGGAGVGAIGTSSGAYVTFTGVVKDRIMRRIVRVGADGTQAPVAPPALKLERELASYSASEDGSALCIGSSSKSSPYVACLLDGRWAERRFEGSDRAAVFIGLQRIGGSLYALMLDGDVGSIDAEHLLTHKFALRVRRWDGAHWVAGLPDAAFTLAHPIGLIECLPGPAPSCEHPLLSEERKTGVRTYSSNGVRWALDGRAWKFGRNDSQMGEPALFGEAALLPVDAGVFPHRHLDVLALTPAGVQRARVAELPNSLAGAQLASSGGELWASFIDLKRQPKKKHAPQGALIAAAPVALAGTAPGKTTTLWSGDINTLATSPSVSVIELAGQPFAVFSAVRGSGALALMRPLVAR